MIRRFSFHKGEQGTRFLTDRLKNAKSYDRIAGYFDSSLLEFAGEAFESVTGTIRIICNSDLNPQDVLIAQNADHAQKISFFKHDPAALSKKAKERLIRLYRLLTGEGPPYLAVRVLPNEAFGLIHGKAGVITLADDSRTSFLGSANETYSGWNLNYELVWEDTSEEACEWVQQEFDRLWKHRMAVPLSDAVVKEVERLIDRKELSIATWRQKPDPPGVLVETPVYRKEFGLWPHQRYFIDQFWKSHQVFGARFVLADQVGLGKTVQLGMAAQLMALTSDLPILVLLPKTLMLQWQTELWDLLEIPTARWTGKSWVDELEIEHASTGKNPFLKCPRRIGLVSQGLVIRGGDQINKLLELEWEGVIVDEGHRARRRKLPKIEERGPALKNPTAEANKLYAFLFQIAKRTRSLLLSTATPVQMHPIEAWDLLRLLSEGNDHILGSNTSHWRRPEEALPYLLGEQVLPDDSQTLWDWLRNPFPPSWEDHNFYYFRNRLDIDDDQAVIIGEHRIFDNLPADVQTRMQQSSDSLFTEHHPFLRFIIRRTRSYLENSIDSKTHEPYLKKIEIDLVDNLPIVLESYLRQGYTAAEDFCQLIAQRVRGAGFFKTLLLRRIGSSIKAGVRTVEKMLGTWIVDDDYDEDEEEEDTNHDEQPDYDAYSQAPGELKELTPEETKLLEECRSALSKGLEQKEGADPKRDVIIRYLKEKNWKDDGCILFSQYYDTAHWIGEEIFRAFPEEEIGLYAGSGKSGIWESGEFLKKDREEIKSKVRSGEVKILVGTDAASEGLNLQALGNLINIDLPWNPTRLEQRKGRIQRIGQSRDTIRVLNLRYKDSVEDKVHQALSDRLEQIHQLFGQIPDVLKNVWVEVALNNLEEAQRLIEDIPRINPFDNRYSKIDSIPGWDTWSRVLNRREKLDELKKGW